MTIISTFELLIKPIAPPSGNPNIDTLFRRVVQGYFLTITNPNSRLVKFRIRARCPRLKNNSQDGIVDRELVTTNHIFTYDITGGPNSGQQISRPLTCRFSDADTVSMVSSNLEIGPLQTASFKLLPNTATQLSANPRLEIRGYIEIAQLVDFGIGGVPPVDLIFTPEVRGSFLDNAYPQGGGPYDFDQIAYGIPTTTGGSLMAVTKTESSLLLCFLQPFPPITNDIQIGPFPLDKYSYAEDADGNRFLDDDGVKQFRKEVEAAKKENPDIKIDFRQARKELEDILNTSTV